MNPGDQAENILNSVSGCAQEQNIANSQTWSQQQKFNSPSLLPSFPPLTWQEIFQLTVTRQELYQISFNNHQVGSTFLFLHYSFMFYVKFKHITINYLKTSSSVRTRIGGTGPELASVLIFKI
jgi:hypothetical protein